ncbi:MAG: carbohydrate ABC transporter permease [Oscillospiraceae bacterium]|nr:carbohydrate ABC transporter permease [Oscillospiraceae bacterium]MBQ8732751.1 carbohydrate ABC transporter permease [Oscillospiraceae bacterium]
MAYVAEKKNPLIVFFKYAVAVILTLLFVFPFYNMLVISLNDSADLVNGYPFFFPRVFSLKNYEAVFQSPLLGRAFLLSIARTVLSTILCLFFTGMLAYVLTRRNLLGKRFFNMLFIATMYVGGGLVPTYIQYRDLGLVNNFLVFVIPSALSVYYMIVMKSYFAGIPDSLEDAAKIDGCNDFSIYVRIYIPVSIPVFAAIGVYTAVGSWNSWWDNYIFANTQDLTTLQLLLVRMIKEADVVTTMGGGSMTNPAFANPMGVRMATTMVATVPILLVYPFFQRYFISGMTIGAVKE